MDNLANSSILKDVQKLEYKSRIKIFINFVMQYYYSEHECSLYFVKLYSILLVLLSHLYSLFFIFKNEIAGTPM